MEHLCEIAPNPGGLSSPSIHSPSPAKQSRHQYTHGEWEAKKSLIVRLYIEENKRIEEVIEALGNEGGGSFVPCRRKLFEKFKEWGIKKYEKKRRRERDGANDPCEPRAQASVHSCIRPDTDSPTLPPATRATLSGGCPMSGPSDESTTPEASNLSGAEVPNPSDGGPDQDEGSHDQLEDDDPSEASESEGLDRLIDAFNGAFLEADAIDDDANTPITCSPGDTMVQTGRELTDLIHLFSEEEESLKMSHRESIVEDSDGSLLLPEFNEEMAPEADRTDGEQQAGSFFEQRVLEYLDKEGGNCKDSQKRLRGGGASRVIPDVGTMNSLEVNKIECQDIPDLLLENRFAAVNSAYVEADSVDDVSSSPSQSPPGPGMQPLSGQGQPEQKLKSSGWSHTFMNNELHYLPSSESLRFFESILWRGWKIRRSEFSRCWYMHLLPVAGESPAKIIRLESAQRTPSQQRNLTNKTLNLLDRGLKDHRREKMRQFRLNFIDQYDLLREALLKDDCPTELRPLAKQLNGGHQNTWDAAITTMRQLSRLKAPSSLLDVLSFLCVSKAVVESAEEKEDKSAYMEEFYKDLENWSQVYPQVALMAKLMWGIYVRPSLFRSPKEAREMWQDSLLRMKQSVASLVGKTIGMFGLDDESGGQMQTPDDIPLAPHQSSSNHPFISPSSQYSTDTGDPGGSCPPQKRHKGDILGHQICPDTTRLHELSSRDIRFSTVAVTLVTGVIFAIVICFILSIVQLFSTYMQGVPFNDPWQRRPGPRPDEFVGKTAGSDAGPCMVSRPGTPLARWDPQPSASAFTWSSSTEFDLGDGELPGEYSWGIQV